MFNSCNFTSTNFLNIQIFPLFSTKLHTFFRSLIFQSTQTHLKLIIRNLQPSPSHLQLIPTSVYLFGTQTGYTRRWTGLTDKNLSSTFAQGDKLWLNKRKEGREAQQACEMNHFNDKELFFEWLVIGWGFVEKKTQIWWILKGRSKSCVEREEFWVIFRENLKGWVRRERCCRFYVEIDGFEVGELELF